MKQREVYSTLFSAPPIVVRLDGRGFHRVAETWGLVRPFDERFACAMADVSRLLIAESGLSPDLAYTFSDEISLYFSHLPFAGRVEKIDSVSASYAASALTIAMATEVPVSFDARIIQVTPELAVRYLIDRQAEAWRNHINATCQHALMSEGKSRREAARALRGLSSAALHEMMFSRGINLAKTPSWQRRGILVYRHPREVEGYNPVEGHLVRSVRTAVLCNSDLPVFSSPEGRLFLSGLIREF